MTNPNPDQPKTHRFYVAGPPGEPDLRQRVAAVVDADDASTRSLPTTEGKRPVVHVDELPDLFPGGDVVVVTAEGDEARIRAIHEALVEAGYEVWRGDSEVGLHHGPDDEAEERR